MAGDQAQLQREVLDRILAVARHLSASADLTEILSVIIDAMRDTLLADRATVFEYDPVARELFTTVAHGVSTNNSETQEIRISITAGLAGECAQRRAIINVPDAYADTRFNQAVDRQTGYRTRSVLTIPLIGHDRELVGVAQVLNKRGGAFDAQDERIAEALAAQAAVAMRRGRLIEDRMVRQKLERDIELARTIQQSSFPQRVPTMRLFELDAWNEPADQTGGDVYDMIPRRDDRNGCAGLVVLMADATGHGVGPAISVTQLRSMVRMAVRLGGDLASIARHANTQLCEDLPGGRFITAWLGEVDDDRGCLTSFSAGQAPMIVYRAAPDSFEVLDADTAPLGVLEDLDASPASVFELSPGDVFAAVSDGVIEAHNAAGEQFGIDRTLHCIRSVARASASEIIASIRQAVERFTAGCAPEDDRTVIIIKRRSHDHAR